jgi:hypothetical protein
MNHTGMIFMFLFYGITINGQISVFPTESMYNGLGGINGESIASWEANDRFENDQLFMSGIGDVRNTFPSDYPAASGSWNVMLNSVGEYFLLSGINALGFQNLELKLGIRKSTQAENGTGMQIEYSNDGITWTILGLSLPSGAGTAGWHEVLVTGYIPETVIMLKFTSLNLTEFRLDDIRLSGTIPCDVQIDSISPHSGPPGTEVSVIGSGFSGASQVFFSSVAASSFHIADDGLIHAIVPEGIADGPIQVFSGCISAEAEFFDILTESCQYNGDNLILSELCDPGIQFQTDRYIEFFNPCSHAIDLQGWAVKAIANFTECETWNLSGIINPGEAKSCGYDNAVNGAPHDFTQSTWLGSIPGSCCNSWNGNRRDGAVLYYGSVKVDEVVYENTAVPWFTDACLIRSETICTPSPITSPAEWIVGPTVSLAGVWPSTTGSHTTNCPGTPPQVSIQPMDQVICEGQDFSISVIAEGGTSPYTFSWMQLDVFGTWAELTEGGQIDITSTATESILTVNGLSILSETLQFYCKVYNQGEGCWSASEAAHVKQKPLPLTSSILHY